MKKKKKDMGMAGPAMGMVTGGVVLGVGSQVVSGVGGSTAASAGGGLVTAASFMPTMGVAIGAGLTLEQVKKLQKKGKR